jgi:hypothetical protein
MVVARWRQYRIRSAEAAGISNEMNRIRYDDDVPTRTWAAFRTLTDSSRTLELLNRYDARFERDFRQNLNCLLQLRERKSRKRGKTDAPKVTGMWWVDSEGATRQAGPPLSPEEESSFGKMTIADLPEFYRQQRESEEE